MTRTGGHSVEIYFAGFALVGLSIPAGLSTNWELLRVVEQLERVVCMAHSKKRGSGRSVLGKLEKKLKLDQGYAAVTMSLQCVEVSLVHSESGPSGLFLLDCNWVDDVFSFAAC